MNSAKAQKIAAKLLRTPDPADWQAEEFKEVLEYFVETHRLVRTSLTKMYKSACLEYEKSFGEPYVFGESEKLQKFPGGHKALVLLARCHGLGLALREIIGTKKPRSKKS